MRVQIFQDCKLYYFDRKTLELGTINPNLVECELINGILFYFLKDPKERDFLIVQAINIKKAAAKFLTIISRYDDIRKNRKNS